jgi:nickel transport protein
MKKIFCLIFCLWGICAPLPAHGVAFDVRLHFPTVVIHVRYDGGGPIAFAPVQVMFPRGGGEFQTGRTDGNGIFSFTPDRQGEWTLFADDEMGHRGTTEFLVDAAFFQGKASDMNPHAGSHRSYLIRLLMGVILILGLSTLFYRWKKERQGRR